MKTKRIIFMVLLFAIIFLNSCGDSWLYPDDELSFKRIDYTGNQLKINGYYYHEYPPATLDNISIYFLYRNGAILDGGSCEKSEINEYEARLRDLSYIEALKGTKYY